MKNKTLRYTLTVLLSVVLLFTLSGCNLGEMKQNDGYVASVKELVNQCINYNRTLKKQEEVFNCHDVEKTKQLVSTMDTLGDVYQQLLQLQPTNEFAEYHSQITERATMALSCISRLKTLVNYSAEHGNDKLYQNDKGEILDEYTADCEMLRWVSSEIQTYWRNA